MTDSEQNKRKEMLQTSSVPLVKLDSNHQLVAGGASGCLLDYKGTRFLLTVAHAMREGPPLSLAIRWDPAQNGVLTHGIGECLSSVSVGTLVPDSKTIDLTQLNKIDFAYCRYPFDHVPDFQELDQSGSGKVLSSRPCVVYNEAQIVQPDPQTIYGFAGHTRTCLELHPMMTIRSTKLTVCDGLMLVGVDSYFYLFQLPMKHPGHEFFEGCSGAPVIDSDGNLVGLVVRGDEEDSTISVIPMSICTQILDLDLATFTY